jgi:hypothetical protein
MKKGENLSNMVLSCSGKEKEEESCGVESFHGIEDEE